MGVTAANTALQTRGVAPPSTAETAAGEKIDDIVPANRPDLAKLITDTAHKYGVPPRLIAAMVKQESGFNQNATSPAGARGLLQLMPATAAELGCRNPTDPAQNLDAGVRYMAGMLHKAKGDVGKALAGYNAGWGAVTSHGGKIPPYPETQKYVRAITATYGGASSVNPRPMPMPRSVPVGPSVVQRLAARSPDVARMVANTQRVERKPEYVFYPSKAVVQHQFIDAKKGENLDALILRLLAATPSLKGLPPGLIKEAILANLKSLAFDESGEVIDPAAEKLLDKAKSGKSLEGQGIRIPGAEQVALEGTVRGSDGSQQNVTVTVPAQKLTFTASDELGQREKPEGYKNLLGL